jgi:hypothetical protein
MERPLLVENEFALAGDLQAVERTGMADADLVLTGKQSRTGDDPRWAVHFRRALRFDGRPPRAMMKMVLIVTVHDLPGPFPIGRRFGCPAIAEINLDSKLHVQ